MYNKYNNKPLINKSRLFLLGIVYHSVSGRSDITERSFRLFLIWKFQNVGRKRGLCMKITFIGATHEVTGSCYYLEAAGRKFLVDYGMEQGPDYYENKEPSGGSG